MVRSVARACSSALTDPERPILKATLVKGKITTSRIGTIGYQATSEGVLSEYSSMIEQLYLRKRPNCKSFPAGALQSENSRKKAQEAQKRNFRRHSLCLLWQVFRQLGGGAVDSGEAFTRNCPATFDHFTGYDE